MPFALRPVREVSLRVRKLRDHSVKSFAAHALNPRSLFTFDAGAEAECFEDLITALANAHANATFFITGRFTQEHADCAATNSATGLSQAEVLQRRVQHGPRSTSWVS